MTKIDTSDCWLEIGTGRNFRLSLVRHFVKVLREAGAAPKGTISLDFEARTMADRFIADMQDYFRATLAEAYDALEHLSPEGIIDLYIDENLADFELDYLSARAAAPVVAASASTVLAATSGPCAPGLGAPGLGLS
jgi:hypothetical protein